MIIRDMISDDKNNFLKMSEDFYHTDAVLHGFSRQIQERNFDSFLKGSPYIRCLMLENPDGEAAGYALVSHAWSSEAGGPMIFLEELYVKPESRGHGLAGGFFRWFFREYQEKAAGFRLEVAPANSAVMGLYKKYGYQPLDYIQMIKPIKRS